MGRHRCRLHGRLDRIRCCCHRLIGHRSSDQHHPDPAALTPSSAVQGALYAWGGDTYNPTVYPSAPWVSTDLSSGATKTAGIATYGSPPASSLATTWTSASSGAWATVSVIVKELVAVAGQTVTPDPLPLILAPFAPVVSVSNNQLVTPATATLTTAAFAPTVSTPRLVVPGVLGLTITTFAPVVALSVIPGVAALTLATFAPTVSTPRLATPGVLALTLTTFAPSITVGVNVCPRYRVVDAVDVRSHGGHACPRHPESGDPHAVGLRARRRADGHTRASITDPDHLRAGHRGARCPWPGDTDPDDVRPSHRPDGTTPATKALTLTTFAPTVLTPVTVTPDTTALVLTTYAPGVAANAGRRSHLFVALTIATFAPTVSATLNITVTPDTASLTLTGLAPVIRLVVTPATASLTLTTYAPSVGAPITVTPDTASLHLAAGLRRRQLRRGQLRRGLCSGRHGLGQRSRHPGYRDMTLRAWRHRSRHRAPGSHTGYGQHRHNGPSTRRHGLRPPDSGTGHHRTRPDRLRANGVCAATRAAWKPRPHRA